MAAKTTQPAAQANHTYNTPTRNAYCARDTDTPSDPPTDRIDTDWLSTTRSLTHS